MPVLPPNPSNPSRPRDATLKEFELSVAEKREAGLLLLGDTTQNFAASGTYLLGYVAEVRLKCAYFRFKEGPSIQANAYEIDWTKRDGANQEAARLAGLLSATAPKHGSYHSIEFWAFLLRQSRVEQRKDWKDPNFDQEFRACTDRLHNNWNVAMRYFPDTSLALDSASVRDDVLWLDTNYNTLWEDLYVCRTTKTAVGYAEIGGVKVTPHSRVAQPQRRRNGADHHRRDGSIL